MNFYLNFTEVCSYWSSWQVNIGLCNGLVLDKQQAITWTNTAQITDVYIYDTRGRWVSPSLQAPWGGKSTDDFPHKGPASVKVFPCHDTIMNSKISSLALFKHDFWRQETSDSYGQFVPRVQLASLRQWLGICLTRPQWVNIIFMWLKCFTSISFLCIHLLKSLYFVTTYQLHIYWYKSLRGSKSQHLTRQVQGFQHNAAGIQ